MQGIENEHSTRSILIQHRVYVYFNNDAGGKAVMNARTWGAC